MGQYYNILTYKDKKYTVYDRSFKNNENDKEATYMLAKLTEHSWIGNFTMSSFSNIIYENPMKVAWVGDYTNQIETNDIHNPKLSLETAYRLHKIAWNRKEQSLIQKDFKNSDKILVNWDKKQYINMKEYLNKNTYNHWCMHPLSLLTAIGNEYGGGDYYGKNKEQVGIWAFDLISFENQEKEQNLINNGFNKLVVEFYENWEIENEHK